MATRLLVHEDAGHLRVSLLRPGHLTADQFGDAVDFAPPLSAEEREELRWYLEDYLVAPYGVYEDRGPVVAAKLPVWGERLFAAVFGPGKPGRDAYVRALEAVKAGPVELVLVSSSPQFLGLPWELCRDPDRRESLALELAGLTRSVPNAGEAAERVPGEELRILMVLSRPAGARDVRYGIVARPLLAMREKVADRVRIDLLRPPTVEALKEALATAREEGAPYQVLHFDGHGAFGRRPAGAGVDPLRFGGQAEGFLAFESATGGEALITAADFAGVLKEHGIPLFVFNACRSGTLADDAGPDAAVATRLLQEGAAAVVAMGYSVYAVAAAEFMAAFYDALFHGKTTAQAVGEGRRQMKREALRPSPKGKLPLSDWMVPVHYARRDVVFPELARARKLATKSIAERLREAQAERDTAAAIDGETVHAVSPLAAERGVFVGRDREFYALERAVRDPRVVVIHGPGGVGKTELAKGFARWLGDSGGVERGGVLLHSFEPGVASFGVEGVINAVGLRLAGTEFFKLDAGARRGFVLQALREVRLLLVWDNFETVHSLPDPNRATPPLDEAGREAMRSFLAAVAQEGRSAVIVTSRSEEAWLGRDVRRIDLRGFDGEEEGEYADKVLSPYPEAAGRRGKKAYGELLTMLGGHPLSLRLVLPYLATTEPEGLVAALRGEQAPGGVFGAEGGRHDSLGACVAYSYRHLAEEHRRRLPAVALFEGVADVMPLTAMSGEDGAPARFCGVDGKGWQATLEAAVAVGLLSRMSALRYQMHPALPGYLMGLWRAEAGEGFGEELAAARKSHQVAHAEYGEWLLEQIQTGSAESALATLAAETRTFGRVAAEALEQGSFEEAQALLQPLDEYWDMAGLFEEARAWVDRCRARVEARDGTPPDFDTPQGGLWLFMVGSQANRLMRAGALAESEIAYDMIRKDLERSSSPIARPRLAVSYHQLGRVAQERGELDKAQDWYEKSLAIREQLGNRPGMADSYHQLGRVAEERGDLDKARDWYEKSLDIMEQLGNRPGMATSYHQLGRVAQERGELDKAQDWYEKSLDIKEQLGNRPGMATSYHQLGRVAEERGELDKAQDWYEKSLDIKEQLGDRPGMAASYNQLGLLAEQRGDSTQALDWTVRAIALFPEFPHPMTGPAPRNLGILTARLGLPALEASWQHLTGAPLPAPVRAYVEQRLPR